MPVTDAADPSRHGHVVAISHNGNPAVDWGYGRHHSGASSTNGPIDTIRPRIDAPDEVTPTADGADHVGVPVPSDSELKALLDFSQGESYPINRALNKQSPQLTPQQQRVVDGLDAMLARPEARVRAPIRVVRGAANSSQFGPVGSKIGKDVVDRRYASTSTIHADADEYRRLPGRPEGQYSARIHYDLQPGDRALPVDRVVNLDRMRARNMSSLSPGDFDHVYSTAVSDELLMPRNQRYRVSDDRIGRDGVREVFLSPVTPGGSGA